MSIGAAVSLLSGLLVVHAHLGAAVVPQSGTVIVN